MQIVKIPFVEDGNEVNRKAPDKIIDFLGKLHSGDLDVYDIKDGQDIHENALVDFENQDKVVFLGVDFRIKAQIVSAFKDSFKSAFLIIVGDFDYSFFENIDLRKVVVVNPGVEGEKLEFLNKIGVKLFSEISDFEAAADFITEKARGNDVYVTVDFGVVDSAFAPGTFNSTIPGLSSREFLYLLRRFFHVPRVRGFDLTGICLEKDEKFDYRTVKLAAKAVKEFLDISGK